MNTLSLLLALTGCGDEDAGAAEQREPMDLPDASGQRVEASTLKLTTAVVELDLPGEVAAAGDATLASPMGGFVEGVSVSPGQAVRKGQVIARIDAAMYKSQAEIAQAQAEQAEAEWTRVQKLGDAVSQQQRLNVETQARVARANAELAQLKVGRAVVTAPFSGRVVDVFVDPGEVSGPGTPVARVVRTDSVMVEVNLSDRDLSLLREGQEVVFRAQGVPGDFTGTVRHVAPAADPGTRTFTAEMELPNPDGALLPGMLGRIKLARTVAEEAVVVPQDWIITKVDARGVFVIEDETAKWRQIELGAFTGDQVVVAQGLDAGEMVVSKGGRALADGDPVVVARSGVCCENGRIIW